MLVHWLFLSLFVADVGLLAGRLDVHGPPRRKSMAQQESAVSRLYAVRSRCSSPPISSFRRMSPLPFFQRAVCPRSRFWIRYGSGAALSFFIGLAFAIWAPVSSSPAIGAADVEAQAETMS